MFYESFIKDEIIKLGGEALDFYIKTYQSMPSCKHYLMSDGEKYDNCLADKCNCAYEKTQEKFKILQQTQKQ